jgi:Na+-transporting methylmalonyl-CoA/oxaloacetate decarboxylase gamma subunit
MTLFGVSFVVAGMLTCLVPISLLICFATFFGRTVRRMPPNATTNGQQTHVEPPAAAAQPPAAERQFPNLPE